MKKKFLFIFLLYTNATMSFDFSPLKMLRSFFGYFSTVIHQQSSPKLKNIDKKLKKIEKFLEIDSCEIHESDICLETLSDEIKKLAKSLNKIAINSLTVKWAEQLKERLSIAKEKIGKLEQQFFVGMRQGEYTTYDDIVKQYKTNFARPLERIGKSFKQFIEEGGVYRFLGFKQTPGEHISYDQVKTALGKKRKKVDEAAQKENQKHHDLTPDQQFCRQIEFLFSDPISEEKCRSVHQNRQAVEACIPDAQTRQKQQEAYTQDNLTAGECKLTLVDLIYGIKSKINYFKKEKKRDQEKWEFIPMPLQQEVDGFVLIGLSEAV